MAANCTEGEFFNQVLHTLQSNQGVQPEYARSPSTPPPGMTFTGGTSTLTLSGTPTQPGTYSYVFQYKFVGGAPQYHNSSILVAPADDGGADNVAIIEFPEAYCVKTLNGTLLGVDGIKGPTIDGLAEALNNHFAATGKNHLALEGGGALQINSITAITAATDCDDAAIPITEQSAPEVEKTGNNDFFGKDDPDSEEYDWYTLIYTGACSSEEEAEE